MAYTLTFDEIRNVRLQLGKEVTSEDVTDVQITSDTILQAAVDYCVEVVLDFIDVDKLTPERAEIVNNIMDGSPTAIDAFVNDVLTSRQRTVFRRAIVYRVAGNCVHLLDVISQETAGGIAQRHTVTTPLQKQALLYRQADLEITIIRNMSERDAVEDTQQRGRRIGSLLAPFGRSSAPTSSEETPGTGQDRTRFNIDSLVEEILSIDDIIAFADSDEGGVMRKSTIASIVTLVAAQALRIEDFDLANPHLDDTLAFADVSQVGNPNRKATLRDILALQPFQLDSLTTAIPALDDTVGFSDVSETGNPNRKMTLQTLADLVSTVSFTISALTGATPALDDEIPFADASHQGTPNRRASIRDILQLARSTFLVADETDGAITEEDLIVFGDSSVRSIPNAKATVRELLSLVPGFVIDTLTSGAPALDDEIVFSDVSEENNPNRKTTVATILALATAAAAFKVSTVATTTPELSDFLVFSDRSEAGSPNRKVTIQDLLGLLTLPDPFSIHDLDTATPALTDFLSFSDESETDDPNRKVAIQDLLALKPDFSIHDLTTATPVLTDFIPFSDESERGDPNRKVSIRDLLALASGSGLFKSYNYVEVGTYTVNTSTAVSTRVSDGTNHAEIGPITPASSNAKFRLQFTAQSALSESGVRIDFQYQIAGSSSWFNGRNIQTVQPSARTSLAFTDVIVPGNVRTVAFRVVARQVANGGQNRLSQCFFEVMEF